MILSFFKRTLPLYFIVFLAFSIYSCGGGAGGDSEFLDTVTVSASTDTTLLDADVAIMQDKDGDGYCDATYIVNPDDITVTINNEPTPNTPENVSESSVRIDKVSISYTSADGNGPALPETYISLGQVVDSGSSVDLSIRVLSQNQKLTYFSDLVGSNIIYKYYVELSFDVVEVLTGKRGTVKTNLTINVGDFKTSDDADCI